MAVSRARITIGDLIRWGAALAFSAPLVVVFMNSLNGNAGELATAEAYLFQLVVPVLIIMVMAVIWITATIGVPR